MHLPCSLNLLLLLALSSLPQAFPAPADHDLDQHSLFANPSSSLAVPSRYISTVLARRLLALSSVGDLATVFPANLSSPSYWNTPQDVAAAPIALPEYTADCEGTGDPTIIALDVSTSTKNAAAGSNVSLTVSWWDEYVKRVGREPWAKADLPRLALMGYLEEMDEEVVERMRVEECFEAVHGDSRLWAPGRRGAAHSGRWMRVKVEQVYWIGGFGDRHFIGWLRVGEWRAVTGEEIEGVRLPGEAKEGDGEL